MCSSVSPSLLLIRPSVFFISVIVFFSSHFYMYIFSISMLKCSLCSSILFLNSVHVFITTVLNSLSSKMFISVSLFVFFRDFLLLFQLRPIPLASHFA